jgi:hypothetical protein
MAKIFKVGPVTVKAGPEAPRRMAVLLWGAAACGKSTFAATAPGKKLWLSFGDQEHVSVMHRNDVKIADLSSLTPEELFKHAKSDNPFGLDQVLAENTDIGTIVCDSATALVYQALHRAVEAGIGTGRRGFIPSIEDPGQAAYGARNAIMLKVLTGLLRITAKHGVHLIVTAHEADPVTEVRDGKEIVSHISVMLGGQLVNNMTFRLSEIWYMSLLQNVRKLAVRSNVRLRRPMKTRMFSGKGDSEFILEYDADLPDVGQMTIASWYEEWSSNGSKIMPPSMKEQIARAASGGKAGEVLVQPRVQPKPRTVGR